jgi:tRNA (guanine-N7-)-methyltransferase
MQYLPHFFVKNQFDRMFVLYPDPHFKKKKEKWRIISVPLLSQYAYFIRPGGKLLVFTINQLNLGTIYIVTDVLQYYEWVLKCFADTKLFEKVDDEDSKKDPIFPHIFGISEEGQKVTRNSGDKYHAIYRRTDLESTFVPDLTKQPESIVDDEESKQEDEEAENEEQAENDKE